MAKRLTRKATRHVAYTLAKQQYNLDPKQSRAILRAHGIDTVNDTNILQVMTLLRRYRRKP
jgi:hypothetical protein